MSRVPTKGIDYTSKDYESFRNDMIQQLRVKMPEYTDISQSDAGIVILELLAQGLDVISYYQDVIANELFLTTAEQRSNALKWCQMLGYVPKSSTPSEFLQVFVLSSVQDTDTVIPAGTLLKTQGTATEPSVYFETKADLVIPAGSLGDEKSGDEYLYTVKVVQGFSVSNELVGTSTEAVNQTFTLGYAPAILDSIEVFVNEGDGFEKWERVTSFVESSLDSKHFVVNINDNDEAVITFGDGVFGKIPKSIENGIFCDYRVGGGLQGNVGANTITTLDSSIGLVASTFNPYTAEIEGQEKESLDEIKRNAPASNRTIWGALTAQDFSEITLANVLSVDKATSYAVGENNRDVDIYVTLKNNAEFNEAIEKEILNIFDENQGGRKIIGSGTISVHPAILTPVNISATLSVKNRYDFETVKGKIIEFLTDFFEVGNYDFDTELSISSLSAEVMNPDNAIDGIRSFRITSPAEEVLVPGNGVIYTLGNVTITNGGA